MLPYGALIICAFMFFHCNLLNLLDLDVFRDHEITSLFDQRATKRSQILGALSSVFE